MRDLRRDVMQRLLLIVGCALVLAASAVRAQDVRSVPFRRVGMIGGTSTFAILDVNGDGIADIISCGGGAPFAMSSTGGSAFKTTWQGPSVGCTAVAAANRESDGTPEVVVVTGSPTSGSPGSLMLFDPRSLGGPMASVLLPGAVGGADVAMADVDADGLLEIVVTTSVATYVYDAATLALQWTADGYGGTKIGIGDVDGDGHLEIVVNGATGYVLDAVAQTLKWGYFGGFGTCMAVGDVDSDGKAEIVFAGAYSSTVTILNGDDFTTRTITGSASSSIMAITIGDASNDGVNEIITGSQWGNIEGHDASTGARLWSITNPESASSTLAVGDVDGDGHREILWGFSTLFVGDANTQALKWRSPNLTGPFCSAIGDVDGDGRPEWVVAFGSSSSSYSGNLVEVFDLATGVSKGTLPLNSYSSFRVTRLAIGQVDGDAAREIVALGAGTSYNNPQILTWDGVTHALEFASAVSSCCSSPSFATTALLVANIDGDPVDDIIVGESDSKVIVLRGATNVIQTSLSTNGYFRDLSLADLNGDGVADLVVGTSNGVYVYDTATWTLHGSVSISGVQRVVANAGSRTVAVAFAGGSQQLSTFTGIDLTPAWTCSSLGSATIGALEIASINGVQRLIAGSSNGTLRFFPLGVSVCPAPTLLTVASTSIGNVTAVEATGDSRPDLLIDSASTSEVDLIGLSSDVRGDVTGDGLITAADIDAILDYVLGAAPGINPSADANADQRIGSEDALVLINYYYANGAAPPP